MDFCTASTALVRSLTASTMSYGSGSSWIRHLFPHPNRWRRPHRPGRERRVPASAEKCIKKEALPPPPERAEGSLTGPLAPRQNGQRNNPKIIIQFFFCVVNTALLPHFVPVVIPHFLPHFQILPHFAPLPQQNAKAGKAFSYAVFWTLIFCNLPRGIGSNPFIRTKSPWQKNVTDFFLCCIVENWWLRQPIFELLFIKMSSGFQTVGDFYCLIFPQNSELRQGRGQFFWEKTE